MVAQARGRRGHPGRTRPRARSTRRRPGRGRRRPAARPRSGPCRHRGAARPAGRRGPSRRSARRVATTSRPWRRSATCIESNSASCAGRQPGRRAPPRSRGVDPGPQVRPELADLRRPPGSQKRLTAHEQLEDRSPRVATTAPMTSAARQEAGRRSSRMNVRTARGSAGICHAIRGGRNANSTCDPSSGGIGIRLKTISTMLMYTKIEHHVEHRVRDLRSAVDCDDSAAGARRPPAMIRFEIGPGDRHDRLAAPAALEVHRVDRRRLRPAEAERPTSDERHDQQDRRRAGRSGRSG